MKRVIAISFSIAMVILTTIPILGILAFGPNLTDPKDPNHLIYFNEDFKNTLPWVYYIVSFYVFLNIAVLPVLMITTRNNLIKLL